MRKTLIALLFSFSACDPGALPPPRAALDYAQDRLVEVKDGLDRAEPWVAMCATKDSHLPVAPCAKLSTAYEKAQDGLDVAEALVKAGNDAIAIEHALGELAKDVGHVADATRALAGAR